ncbi:hypothetical protein [Methylorubrum aminovorans]|uniref:hypothetical protein n=1 Tax=Methylorubrum aminovorans TaxID=269069 RepID=UPI003C2F7D9E
MSDPDAEVWRYTFEPGPDFSLSVRGEIIGRVQRDDTIATPPHWGWSITCVRQFIGLTKPSRTDSGYVETKQEAVEALRAAWALERDWRAEMRALTAYHDAGMSRWVALTAWQTYERPASVEVRGLLGFAQGLGLDEFKTWEIHQAVAQEADASEANRDARMAEVRKRMLAAAR